MLETAFGATVLASMGLGALVAFSYRRVAQWPLGGVSAVASALIAAGAVAGTLPTGTARRTSS